MTDFNLRATERNADGVGALEIQSDGELYCFDVTWDDLVALRHAFAERETEILQSDECQHGFSIPQVHNVGEPKMYCEVYLCDRCDEVTDYRYYSTVGGDAATSHDDR